MAGSGPDNPAQDVGVSSVSSSASKPKDAVVPKGWTSSVYAPSTLEAMLRLMTSLTNIQVRIIQQKGPLLVFASGKNFYFWNSVVESAEQVTEPTDYDELLARIGTDIRKVKVKVLPDPAPGG
ncbi:hypothetical protein BD779DRAFT_1516136 [Infundibulicybe gibba]|nr:hypothetical protein BD779DRAFT_1516136 [Infundibulicybe gibba]